MSEKYPSRLAEKIMVRLPDGMRARLSDSAKANKRSVNAEVVSRLEASFRLYDSMQARASEPEFTGTVGPPASTVEQMKKLASEAQALSVRFLELAKRVDDGID